MDDSSRLEDLATWLHYWRVAQERRPTTTTYVTAGYRAGVVDTLADIEAVVRLLIDGDR